MNKNPIVNAIAAAIYIVIIVFVMQTTTSITSLERTIFMPMVMIGLFVLSSALMGYLFVFEPFKLYMDGLKQEAVNYFLKTLGFFAGIVIVFIVLVLVFLGK